MAVNRPQLQAGKPLTPLWVISLFVSLTEAVLGIAETKTTGGVQLALTVFVIAFPSIIAGAFFAVLWSHFDRRERRGSPYLRAGRYH